MENKILENTYLEIIENQLSKKEPKCTLDTFEVLVRHGQDEDEIKALLASILDLQVRNMIADNQEFDEDMWEENLKRMSDYVLDDIKGNTLSLYQMDRNMQRMRKEVGFISEAKIADYEEELGSIEATLYAWMKMFDIHADNALYILKAVCNRLYGYMHNQTYDFFTSKDKTLFVMINILEEKCNPYKSNYVKTVLEDHINLDHSEDTRLFTPMIKCLQKICKSIEFWEKEHGHDGYIKYMDRFSNILCEFDPYSVFTKNTLNK